MTLSQNSTQAKAQMSQWDNAPGNCQSRQKPQETGKIGKHGENRKKTFPMVFRKPLK